MNKRQIKYDTKYIISIIKERKCHHIRGWLMELVDAEVVKGLVPYLGKVIANEYKTARKTNAGVLTDEFKDCAMFLKTCFLDKHGDYDYSAITKTAIYAVRRYNNGDESAIEVLPYLINREKEWAVVLRKSLLKILSNVSYKDAISLVFQLITAYYFAYGQISETLADVILGINNSYSMNHSNEDVSNVSVIMHNTGKTADIQYIFAMATGLDTARDMSQKLMDVEIKIARDKYPALRVKYELGNIWKNVPYYYPNGCKDYMVLLAYLYTVTNMEKTDGVELSWRIYPMLERVVFEYGCTHDDEVIADIVSMLSKTVEYNVNNVRFLIPFRDIRIEEVSVTIGITLKKVLATLIGFDDNAPCNRLRDFKYLYDNYNNPIMFSNNAVQKAFIRRGGDASTLLKSHLNVTVNTYIYDASGLITAIGRGTIDSLSALLQDREIVDIIRKEIVGKVYYYNTISFIVHTILSNRFTINEDIQSLISDINRLYPIAKGDTDTDHIRIANLSSLDSRYFSSDEFVPNVPVSNQNYHILLCYLITKHNYVPLYYGMSDNKSGIDQYFHVDMIDELIDISPGYVGELSSGVIGKAMIIKHSHQK